MKKAKIQEVLSANGVQFEETATVDDLKALAAENEIDLSSKPAAEKITVIAKRSLFEGGKSYAPGDEVETTAERAKALGAAVGTPEAE